MPSTLLVDKENANDIMQKSIFQDSRRRRNMKKILMLSALFSIMFVSAAFCATGLIEYRGKSADDLYRENQELKALVDQLASENEMMKTQTASLTSKNQKPGEQNQATEIESLKKQIADLKKLNQIYVNENVELDREIRKLQAQNAAAAKPEAKNPQASKKPDEKRVLTRRPASADATTAEASGSSEETVKSTRPKKGFGLVLGTMDFAEMTMGEAVGLSLDFDPGFGIEYRGKNYLISYQKHTLTASHPLVGSASVDMSMTMVDYLYRFNDDKERGFFAGAGRSAIACGDINDCEGSGAWNLMLGYDLSRNIALSYVRNWTDDDMADTQAMKFVYTFAKKK